MFDLIIKKITSSKLINKSLWHLLGTLISKAAVFITSILAVRLLGPENFGRIGIIQQTTAMLITFSVMGLSQTAILFVGNSSNKSLSDQIFVSKKIFRIGLLTSLIMFALYLVLVDFIAYEVFGDGELKSLLQLCSLVLVGSTLNQVQFGVMSGLGLFNKMALTNISTGLLSVPLTYYLMVEQGIQGFVLALIINCWITFILNRFFINKNFRPLKVLGTKFINEPSYYSIMKYASSNVIGAILFTGSTWFALSVLSRRGGLEEVGVFNASMQIFSILYLLPSILSQVLMSVTAQSGINSNSLRKIILTIFMLVSFSSFLLSYFNTEILSIYSKDFIKYSLALTWILATVPVASIVNILDHYSNGLGLVKVRIVSHLTFALFYSVLALINVNNPIDLALALFFAYLARFLILYCFLSIRLRLI
ncbi:oligosaccharide flippase family protein [Psychrobacter pacificensis]|uniref:oligosaccharide flippase family protein n=1 Tax=Psychrobacter pacificensis TaxID=112002 RepID=UPI003D27CBBA